MERVLTWPELQSKWSVDGQTDHTQRDVERSEHQRRPRRARRAADADRQDSSARYRVHQIHANIGGVHSRRLHAERVQPQQQAAIEQQPPAEHQHAEPCQTNGR
ncbi:MAG: hypothetical protein JOZ65_09790 [Chloroflexi bacterium]|nr:hypothetical protein [Chloroflexota bacterium]